MNRGSPSRRRGRVGAAWLALALAATPSGCAQLKNTDWVSRRGEPGKVNRLLGRNRGEPPLELHGEPTNGPTWTSIAAGDIEPAAGPNRAPADSSTRRASAPPVGAVPALGIKAIEPAPDEPLALSEPSADRAQPAPPEPVRHAPDRLTPAPRAEAPPPPADQLATIADLLEQGRRKLEPVSSYRLRLTRQERVGGRLLPEETVLLSVRRQPLGIRLEWPEGSANAGREVLYSDTECQGMMHIRLANGITIPSMRPDNPQVMKNSRRPIHTAGLDPVLTETTGYVQAIRSGDESPGVMTYEGLQAVDGSSCHAIVRSTPGGERWVLYIDEASLLPTKVEGHDAGGELLESFRFDQIEFDPAELADAGAFDPAKRFGSGQGVGGFLGRLAKAASEASATPATDQQTLPK